MGYGASDFQLMPDDDYAILYLQLKGYENVSTRKVSLDKKRNWKVSSLFLLLWFLFLFVLLIIMINFKKRERFVGGN